MLSVKDISTSVFSNIITIMYVEIVHEDYKYKYLIDGTTVELTEILYKEEIITDITEEMRRYLKHQLGYVARRFNNLSDTIQ